MMTDAEATEADGLKQAFRELCEDYEEVVDEAADPTQPVDERIGLALFKIDEACAATDTVRVDAAQAQQELMDALLANCNELEDIFIRVDVMERFLGRMHDTTRTLEKRMDTISRAAGPVFNPGTMTNMLRNLSIKRGVTTESPAVDLKWEPVAFDFDAKKLAERLENSSARDLGVSISSSSSAQ